MKCSVEGCNNNSFAKGYCNKHYKQISIHGGLRPEKERKINRTCSVEGCNNHHLAKGYCSKHYQQIKRSKNNWGGVIQLKHLVPYIEKMYANYEVPREQAKVRIKNDNHV